MSNMKHGDSIDGKPSLLAGKVLDLPSNRSEKNKSLQQMAELVNVYILLWKDPPFFM